jgi:hypothetical protein
MRDFHAKIPGHENLRTKIFAGLLAGAAAPAVAAQPVWQPAIYCAALDLTRAELLAGMDETAPERAGTPEAAELSGRVYRRIAAEALDCPDPDRIDAMIATAQIGIAHRIAMAEGYGLGPEVSVLPLGSESELVCALHFDPALIDAARAAETAEPPAHLCPGSG